MTSPLTFACCECRP